MSNGKMGGPAFPLAIPTDWDGDPWIDQEGMTLWDYYAAAALAGASADPQFGGRQAQWAAEMADDMIAERAKRLNTGNNQ